MGTEIKTWQIVDGKLQPINTALKDGGRTEPYDLEPWLASHPSILGDDVAIIGRQVMTRSGPLDLLGVDNAGNLVIIEIKRDKLPREALAQAIDYASDVAGWRVERLGEICQAYSDRELDEVVTEAFGEVDMENLSLNASQRILLVGFHIDSALERMIEWLSGNFDVGINAIVLNYIKTSSGDELLARTSVIPDEEQERAKKRRRFPMPMSDEPGEHDDESLEALLREYLSRNKVTNRIVGDVLLPALLKQKRFTREELKENLCGREPDLDPGKIGLRLASLSSQLGMGKNDFLRQVISYGYPNHRWEKDNFSLREGREPLVERLLQETRVEREPERG